MIRYILYSILFFGIAFESESQKNDYVWELGFTDAPPTKDHDTLWVYTKLDFNYDPVRISYDPGFIRTMNTRQSVVSYSDSSGNFRFMTNLCYMVDSNHDTMMYGDTIFYEALSPFIYPDGNRIFQGGMALPSPSNMDIVLVLAQRSNEDFTCSNGLWSRSVYLNGTNLSESISQNDKVIYEDSLAYGFLSAVRHGNGRDWWIVCSGLEGELITLLYDIEGVRFWGKQQLFERKSNFAFGQAKFSPDGKLYSILEFDDVERKLKLRLFDFDRCSGSFSNLREDNLLAPTQTGQAHGLIFSPNSQYLYVSNIDKVYQYEMFNPDLNSHTLVGEFDGFHYQWPGASIPMSFGSWMQGPDGMLYMVPAEAGAVFLHRLRYPDEEGTEATFVQRDIRIGNHNRSSYQFPHYRLGPLDGSACDTLGIDNNPVAKYRYEQDADDYLKVRFTDLSYYRPESWDWDFDDSSVFDGKKPYWHTFPESGTYNVCLTVANENGSDQVCRAIKIGDPTNTMDIPQVDISVFPNPLVNNITITLYDYLPKDGKVVVYNETGTKEFEAKIIYGHNSLDISTVKSGLHILEVYDGRHLLYRDKIIKVE